MINPGLPALTKPALQTRTPAQTTEFIVHYGDGSTPTTAAQEVSILKAYDAYHRSKGWGGIGYSLAVGPVTGNVYEARGLNRVGAHTKGHNTSGVGTVLIGGKDALTTKAKQGLQEAYRIANAWAGKTLKPHVHMDFADTDCPGQAATAWVRTGGLASTPNPTQPTTKPKPEGATNVAKPTTKVDGRLVAAGTAQAFTTVAKAFKQATGYSLHVRDGLRTYEQQKDLWDRWKGYKKPPFYAPSVAKPGTSLHETGRALDVYDSGTTPGVTVANNARSNWLKNNAHRYNFKPTGYSFNEPWHIEFQGNPYAATNTTTKYPKGYIKDIQQRLIDLGYNLGPSGADDSKGPATDKAILAFQKHANIRQDADPGSTTLARLKVEAIQKAVRATRDTLAGPDTQKRVDAVRKASKWGGGKFPYGVKFAQQVVGTKDDGSWGGNSVKAHDATVEKIQKAVGANPDGIWGPDTDKKVKAVIG